MLDHAVKLCDVMDEEMTDRLHQKIWFANGQHGLFTVLILAAKKIENLCHLWTPGDEENTAEGIFYRDTFPSNILCCSLKLRSQME